MSRPGSPATTTPTGDGPERGLVRLYAWMMVAATTLTVVAALLATRSSPTYAATAEVLVAPTITKSGSYITPSMPTEQRVATSGEVAGRAAARLGLPVVTALANVSVTIPVDTQLLEITYMAPTPRQALHGARAFTREYLAYRNPPDGKNQIAALVTPASLPSVPQKPNYALVLGVAVVGGMLLGFGAAWTWDRARGRLRTLADVRRHTGLDVVGTLPRPTRPPGRTEVQPPPGDRPPYDLLVARVPGLAESRDALSVLVTGAARRCGTSTTALGIALALVRLGRRVVLVSADEAVVRRLQRDLTAPGEVAAEPWTGVGLVETRVPRLMLATPEGTDEAVGLDRMALKLRTLALDALVVVDGPPAGQCAALALAVDRVLLVTAFGRVSRSEAALAAEALEHVPEKIVGCVVTAPHAGLHVAEPKPVEEVLRHPAAPAVDPFPVSAVPRAPARVPAQVRREDVPHVDVQPPPAAPGPTPLPADPRTVAAVLKAKKGGHPSTAAAGHGDLHAVPDEPPAPPPPAAEPEPEPEPAQTVAADAPVRTSGGLSSIRSVAERSVRDSHYRR